MIVVQRDYRYGGHPRLIGLEEGDSLMYVPSEIPRCAAFVCRRIGHSKKSDPIGTAFFISISDEPGDLPTIYLVTVRHVIEDFIEKESPSVFIRMNYRHSPCDEFPIPTGAWRFHLDSSVDVSVCEVNQYLSELVDYDPIPEDMMGTAEAIARGRIGIGDEVFYTGLFTEHTGEKKNLPIVRIGNISLMPHEPIQSNWHRRKIEGYLVEARSMGGLSGCPVFVAIREYRPIGLAPRNYPQASGALTGGAEFFWLGVMHGHWDIALSESKAAKDLLAGKTAKINMGLSIVVPFSKVLEVINQEGFMKARKNRVLQERLKHAATPDIEESSLKHYQFQDALKKVSRRKTQRKH